MHQLEGSDPSSKAQLVFVPLIHDHPQIPQRVGELEAEGHAQ